MPELPDVEVMRRYAEARVLGRRIGTVSVRPDGMKTGTSEGTLRGALRTHDLRETRRHGKHLFLRSSEERGRWLRLHFGMTGWLHVWDGEGKGEEPDATRLRVDFEDGGHLAFVCPRKLGEIDLVEDPDAWVEAKGLGPDPMAKGFGLRDVRARLEGRSGAVKATLMNQEVLSGLGNVYTDEALFQAGIDPRVAVDTLDDDAVASLWRAVRRVLENAVEYGADPEAMPDTWLLPHREDGADCPRCGGTIRKTEVSGRATYFCDRHQED